MNTHLDSEDKRTLGLLSVWVAAGIVGAASVGLAAGVMVRLFTLVAGI